MTFFILISFLYSGVFYIAKFIYFFVILDTLLLLNHIEFCAMEKIIMAIVLLHLVVGFGYVMWKLNHRNDEPVGT